MLDVYTCTLVGMNLTVDNIWDACERDRVKSLKPSCFASQGEERFDK